ncbi:unnamed protein product [Acanthoscelides obtectus]|uniref:Uncharacterized protein n=1 Tax=Acanthoscelides obtectus TaxID=200917 RepID=A0A9P0LZK1_ACAOB|nr:unnamed protein product [Acanthoscelides obtectus]CAK1668429.1 hypothetical protein AOBTE_LOCUS26389 [Acanthoscelides obtectus]
MPRLQRSKKNIRRRNRIVAGSSNRVKLSTLFRQSNIIGYLQLTRLILTSLPITGITSLTSLFDVIFSLVAKKLGAVNYNVGAYAMFTVTPAALLLNSPLLAKDTNGGYSFPGHPVSVKWIKSETINTTQRSEISGR